MTLAVFSIAAQGNLRAQTLPKGWYKTGAESKNYEMRLEIDIKHGGKAGATLKHKNDAPRSTGGTLAQAFNNYPLQPINANFEEGAEPERKAAKVDPKIEVTHFIRRFYGADTIVKKSSK